MPPAGSSCAKSSRFRSLTSAETSPYSGAMSWLDPRLLLQGYAAGIFPMADSREAAELFWVEPRSRAIIPLDKFHMSRRFGERSDRVSSPLPWTVTFLRSFAPARTARRRGSTPNRTRDARAALAPAMPIRSRSGSGGELVGGLYGVKLGRAFFGESMFSRMTDASKVALAWLVARLAGRRLHLARLPVHDPPPRLARRGQRCRDGPMSSLLSAALGGAGRRAPAAGAALSASTAAFGGAVGRLVALLLRPIFSRSTGCSRRPGAAGAAGRRRICHRAALGPDVVDRVLDDVERRRFLVDPAREDAAASFDRAAARRAGRTRRSASRSPTARSSRRRAAARSHPSTRTAWPGFSVMSRTIPLRLLRKPEDRDALRHRGDARLLARAGAAPLAAAPFACSAP